MSECIVYRNSPTDASPMPLLGKFYQPDLGQHCGTEMGTDDDPILITASTLILLRYRNLFLLFLSTPCPGTESKASHMLGESSTTFYFEIVSINWSDQS